jgi:hypothetical protein
MAAEPWGSAAIGKSGCCQARTTLPALMHEVQT